MRFLFGPSVAAWALPIATLVSCDSLGIGLDKGSEGTDPEDSGIEEIPTDTGDGGEESTLGTITGLVTVELYETDDNGDIVEVDWEEAYGDDFPFGSIFVAAFTLDIETGATVFHDEYVIRSPDVEGNEYTLEVDPEVAPLVSVYAVLDYWADGILASNEPTGVYPAELPLAAGDVIPDIDVEIRAPYYDFGDGSGGGGGGADGVGGGGGGDGSGDYVTISGDALITESYAGGSCVALLYDSAGGGPYFAKSFTPSKTDDGALGTYEMKVTPSFGAGDLMGAWDSNYNGLFDPSDEWGSWVDETGALMNPLTVGSEDLPDHTLMIPDGSTTSVSVVPFVLLAGDVIYNEGYETMDPGGSIFVAAIKYRPEADITIDEVIAESYDYAEYSNADLSGTAQSFSLILPANTLVYLWAYTDEDGDGVINEVDTPVASYGEEEGRIATGNSSQTDIEMVFEVHN